ncbi:hypothetical protein [Pseudoclavibacter helvolus]|uniref:hypothetical protein n=1 Tax=Pseudoclavibacter helvolus TaxID=255205 RepID=UPI003C75D3B7
MTQSNSHEPGNVKRRTIITGAAWTIPVVAVATTAPFASASPCSQLYDGTLRVTTGVAGGTNYTRTSPTAGAATIPLTGAPATVAPVGFTASSVFTADYAAATNTDTTPRNLQTGANGLALFQVRTGASASNANGQTVTLTFDRPVQNLRFDLKGFTWPADNTYRDVANISPAPTSVTTLGSQVSGTGSAASPWQAAVVQTNPAVSTANSVNGIFYAGPIQTITVHYYSSTTLTTNVPQAIYFSNMTFQAGC